MRAKAKRVTFPRTHIGTVAAGLVLARAVGQYTTRGRFRGRAYLLGKVEAVHVSGCPATRTCSKRIGPCDCGAQALYDAWRAAR